MMRTVDDVLAWLESMPAADAVKVARLLADGHASRAMSQYADRVVYEMSRERTVPEVARELGEQVKQVRRAVERERDRLAGRPPR